MATGFTTLQNPLGEVSRVLKINILRHYTVTRPKEFHYPDWKFYGADAEIFGCFYDLSFLHVAGSQLTWFWLWTTVLSLSTVLNLFESSFPVYRLD